MFSYNNRIDNCNFIKVVLMLAVVLCHSVSFWSGDWFTAIKCTQHSRVLSLLSSWTGAFHVYGFVLVSGYLFFYLKNEKGKYTKIIPFLVNKTKRLIIPYCFAAFIWVVPITTFFYSFELKEIVYKYLLCESPSQLWFLWMLFWIFFIAWPLSNFFKNHFFIGVIIVCSIWVIGIICGRFTHNYFCVWTSLQYIPFFYLGYKIRQFDQMINYKLVLIISTIIFFVVFGISNGLVINVSTIFKTGFDFILHLSGSLSSFTILQFLANILSGNIIKKKIESLSRYTMIIYLFHQQWIYIMIYLLHGKVNIYFNAIVNFLIAIVASVLIGIVLLKFKVSRFLVGEKNVI